MFNSSRRDIASLKFKLLYIIITKFANPSTFSEKQYNFNNWILRHLCICPPHVKCQQRNTLRNAESAFYLIKIILFPTHHRVEQICYQAWSTKNNYYKRVVKKGYKVWTCIEIQYICAYLADGHTTVLWWSFRCSFHNQHLQMLQQLSTCHCCWQLESLDQTEKKLEFWVLLYTLSAYCAY